MNFDLWVKTYENTYIDWDNVASYQCVDLAKCYLQCVFGIKTKGKGTSPWGDAKDYYLDFDYKSWGGYKPLHNAGFVKIKNTADFVPLKGDICVWNNGKYGHIAVATGEGNTKEFWSYDQNWNGKFMHKVKHNYSFFLGVLRPPHTIRADVNIRTGAGVNFNRVGEFKKGEKVIVYEFKNGWARVGKDKWISSNYLERL